LKVKIIWDSGSNIIEYGFCWNTSGNPTKADFHIEADELRGILYGKLEDLSGGTKYFVRSYAINSAGVSYGQVKIFTTEVNKLPTVSPPWITYISHDKVHCSGGGFTDNTNNMLTKGICWSTSINPTVDDTKVDLGSDFETFSCEIGGLNPGTVYYIRAYATNILGTSYGQNRVIRTFDGYMRDYEGNIYNTVRLGNQEWMNRNLETNYFSNGDKIKTTDPPNLNIEQEDKPVYQWAAGYSNQVIPNDYGRLYTWYTATDSRNLCPMGWHLPSLDEWNELLVHVGGDTVLVGELRHYYWKYNNPGYEGATEGSFCARKPGFRSANGKLERRSYVSYWWSGAEASSVKVYTIYCGDDTERVRLFERNKKNGYSVRCVKD